MVADDKEELASLAKELDGLYAYYAKLIDAVSARVSSVSERIRDLFSEYAQSFMAEKCHLALSTYRGKLGESRQFDYPCFNVQMTSATSPDAETVRTNDEDVSESQREFIDLAFRMALIKAVTSDDARAMLVIETPEASLDAYFVDQAGELLRRFARGDEADGNVVIVSSNLARQNMIGALLGLSSPDESTWPNSAAIEGHMINMLEEARPNAALRQQRALYEEALKEATRGRLVNRVD
jgi:hypothetical protein